MDCNEVEAAKTLLLSYHKSNDTITETMRKFPDSSIISKNSNFGLDNSLYMEIERLNESLSFAAYNYFHSEVFNIALSKLKSISAFPGALLTPIVIAIRAGDVGQVDATISMANNLGLFHRSFIHTYIHNTYSIFLHSIFIDTHIQALIHKHRRISMH